MLAKYIVFEGIDGTGKSTQIEFLFNYLHNLNMDVIRLKEPSDSVYGIKIKEAVKSKQRLSFNDELELFTKDREWNVENFISHAVHLNAVILQDRSYFSTAAYQGSLGVMDYKEILNINEKFAYKPDILLIFFADIDLALERINKNRNVITYMEKKNNLIKVNEIYRRIHESKSYNSFEIDANKSILEIEKQILNILKSNGVINGD